MVGKDQVAAMNLMEMTLMGYNYEYYIVVVIYFELIFHVVFFFSYYLKCAT